MGKRKTKEDFIKEANLKHCNKYNYNKVEYKNNKIKIIITCPIHGDFLQRPDKHLQGNGCPYCQNNINKTTNEFINEAIQVHGDKYDYSKVEYINNKTKVCIICPEHGEFWQIPKNHIHRGQGCPICANIATGNRCKLNKLSFINKANQIHNYKYDYSKIDYVNMKSKILIICPEHGEFWQIPTHHISMKCGCPKCNRSHLEEKIERVLIENNINFEYQKRFKWLNRQSLDFYLPEYNIGIECQGIQHFKPVDFFGGLKGFAIQLERDDKKNNKCNENNIQIFYYSDKQYNEEIITNKQVLIEKILKYKK